MQVAHVGVEYSDEFLEQLAKEIKATYAFEVANEPTVDASGECEFAWPTQLWKESDAETILTPTATRFCYLEQTRKDGWFQLFTHKNTKDCYDFDKKEFLEWPLFDPKNKSRSCPEFCTPLPLNLEL